MSKTPKAPNYAYLEEKDPSSLHHALSAFLKDHGGPEVDPKAIQAILSAHGAFQRSDYNKNREEYKARTAQSIYKGGVTTAQNFHFVLDEEGNEVRVEGPDPAKEEAPKAPTKAPAKAPARRTTAKAEPKAPAKTTTRRPRKTVATATK